MNQSQQIQELIDGYLEKGMTDKNEIYTKVVDDLNVPRPTVRRVARDFRDKLQGKINILEKEYVAKKRTKIVSNMT